MRRFRRFNAREFGITIPRVKFNRILSSPFPDAEGIGRELGLKLLRLHLQRGGVKGFKDISFIHKPVRNLTLEHVFQSILDTRIKAIGSPVTFRDFFGTASKRDLELFFKGHKRSLQLLLQEIAAGQITRLKPEAYKKVFDWHKEFVRNAVKAERP